MTNVRKQEEEQGMMDHPDPFKHQVVSFAKSAIRIAGSVAATIVFYTDAAVTGGIVLAVAYGVAEVIGIYEELV